MAVDVPPTASDIAMTKRHTTSSFKYNLQPHGLDHLSGAVKALDRLKQYDSASAQKLAKQGIKKLTLVVKKLHAHAGVAYSLASARHASSLKKAA